jgi:hypothetical protein
VQVAQFVDRPVERRDAIRDHRNRRRQQQVLLDVLQELEIYGWETSFWRNIRGYLGF